MRAPNEHLSLCAPGMRIIEIAVYYLSNDHALLGPQADV